MIVKAVRVAGVGAKPRGFFHFVQSNHDRPTQNAQIHDRTHATPRTKKREPTLIDSRF